MKKVKNRVLELILEISNSLSINVDKDYIANGEPVKISGTLLIDNKAVAGLKVFFI